MKGILCWLALAASVVGTRGGNTSCTVSASPVKEGQFVSITCFFSQDLKGESVAVTRTAPDNNEPQGVLDCAWNKSSTSHNCKTQQPGYQSSKGVVGSKVRLVIPRVSKSHDGQYLCHILGQDKNGQSPCTLTVNETAFDTSCDSPSVTKGASASVTCYFNKDVRQSRVEFAVIREPLVAGEHNSGTEVLGCFWLNEHLNCTTHTGYTVDASEISSLLTLHIANSSEEHEGRYTCKVSSSVVAKETSCYFRLKETAFDTSCDSPSVTKGASASVTCYFNKDVRQSRVEFAVIREPLVAGEHNSGTEVLGCFWLNEHLNCTTHTGYTVNASEISSLLTLHIANSSEEHEGRYTCKVSSSVVAKETSCYFRLKEAPGQDEQKEVASGDGEAKDIAISNLFFTLLILVLIVISVLIGICVRCMKKRQTDGHGTGHELENLNEADQPHRPPDE